MPLGPFQAHRGLPPHRIHEHPARARHAIALSLAVEGWAAISTALQAADAAAWAAVAWQAWGNSLFGYAAWGWLLARHPAATITPMALLVPVFGMSASALWLDESLPPWKLAAAALVIQVQVFFTIGLSMRLSGERVRGFQWFALLLAAAGIAVIILHTDGTTTPLGLLLVLMAALSWAGGNIAAIQGAPANMVAYVVWSSGFAVPPRS